MSILKVTLKRRIQRHHEVIAFSNLTNALNNWLKLLKLLCLIVRTHSLPVMTNKFVIIIFKRTPETWIFNDAYHLHTNFQSTYLNHSNSNSGVSSAQSTATTKCFNDTVRNSLFNSGYIKCLQYIFSPAKMMQLKFYHKTNYGFTFHWRAFFNSFWTLFSHHQIFQFEQKKTRHFQWEIFRMILHFIHSSSLFQNYR